MNDAIKRIKRQDNLDEIYNYIKHNLFINGPISISTMEIICYLNIFAPEYFSKISDDLLAIMGVFYKKPIPKTFEAKIFELYGDYIADEYNSYYTPVQADIIRKIEIQKHFSFSAPTSTGKSFVFRHLIEKSTNDVVIIVPSRALINEYYEQICNVIQDKHVNILTFVDIINTKHAIRNVFILTPERAKDLFKYKYQLNVELFLFDEAQLSNEENTRGLFFDSIVRRVKNTFPDSKLVFAHPFINNPEAQLIKNKLDFDELSALKYEQKNVGQIFFAHDGKNYFHFGIDTTIMGKYKVSSNYDPVMKAIHSDGSVLIYTSKTSIYDKSIFQKFNLYVSECRPLTVPNALTLIADFKKCIGANDKGDGYYSSSMLEYMKKGIIVHHGSLPLQSRLILERFTQMGFCRICFATSTLEQGINMPFDVVYLNKFEASKSLSLKNLIGRAGRSTKKTVFDFGSVVIKKDNMSSFRKIMLQHENMNTTSLLDEADDTEEDYREFKEAINNGEYSDEFNLTNRELERLSENDVHELVSKTLDSLFKDNQLIALLDINSDSEYKLSLYQHIMDLYKYYLGRSELSAGEESVLKTAIKIMLWKIHCKTFKTICWYRYAYVARIPERRDLYKQYSSVDTIIEKEKIKSKHNNLSANFVRGYQDLPNKNLPNFSIYPIGTRAIDTDYDRIVFDTYDYIDKLIGFKLSDIYYAIFMKYYEKFSDERALKMAKYFKYGTDDTKEIWMLRYGLTFEDIEILKPHVLEINQTEILFSPTVHDLIVEDIKSIERYL